MNMVLPNDCKREDANELCHDFTIRCEVRRPVETIDLVDGPVGRVSDDSGDGGDEGGETGGDSPVSARDESKSPLHTTTTTSGSSKSNRKTNNYSLSKSLIGTKSNTILRTVTRTIYTAGRPPWYDAQGQLLEPLIIGICGGSASGKTTVARKIIEALDVPWVTILSMDSFYKVLSQDDSKLARKNEYNFDHPDAFDFDLMVETLQKLKEGKSVQVPVYNFVTHSRAKQPRELYGANVIILEGILIFHNKKLLDMMDMRVFIDTDPDERLARRLRRDITERGRDLEGVIKQYNTFVKPSFEYYIAPTVKFADLIVPRGGDNEIAIDLIVKHIHKQLRSLGHQLRPKLLKSHLNQPLPETLKVLPMTPQMKGLHTFIRNRKTSRDEFIFYSKRLMRLLFEYALSLLPFKDVTVSTPQGVSYNGKKCESQKICAVSIVRAGETMEQPLASVVKDVRFGKICIQTNQCTREPELHYVRFPKGIKDYRIIVMDATVGTGASAMMAIRVLLDHEVPQENIILCSLLMAQLGVHSIAYAYPKVTTVTTEVDPEVNDEFSIRPGMGNYGDRFFGT